MTANRGPLRTGQVIGGRGVAWRCVQPWPVYPPPAPPLPFTAPPTNLPSNLRRWRQQEARCRLLLGDQTLRGGAEWVCLCKCECAGRQGSRCTATSKEAVGRAGAALRLRRVHEPSFWLADLDREEAGLSAARRVDWLSWVWMTELLSLLSPLPSPFMRKGR